MIEKLMKETMSNVADIPLTLRIFYLVLSRK
jgi:hypothetical protein